MPVDLVYIDVQMGVGPRGKYTACIAAIISSDQLHKFRKSYYLKAVDVLELCDTTDSFRHVGRVPILHGSDLLREYSDAIKVEMIDLLLTEFTKFGGIFARVGYYDESARYLRNHTERIASAVNNFRLTFAKRNCPFCFIHEADQNSLEKDHPSYQSQSISMYYQIGEERISFDLENFLGDFVTQKHELGCQVADTSGYLAKKRGDSGAFAVRLRNLQVKFSQYYIFDELIWWQNK